MSHYRFMTEPEGNSETNNHSNKKHFLNHPFFKYQKKEKLITILSGQFDVIFVPVLSIYSECIGQRNLCLVPVDLVEMTKCLAKWMKGLFNF